jgi:hypothetical protein
LLLDWSRVSFRCQGVEHKTNVDQDGMVHLEKKEGKKGNLISFIEKYGEKLFARANNFTFYECFKQWSTEGRSNKKIAEPKRTLQ